MSTTPNAPKQTPSNTNAALVSKMIHFADGIPPHAEITYEQKEVQVQIIGSKKQLEEAKRLGIDLDSFFAPKK